MIVPERAPVRPRVYLPISGETAPLEEEIGRLLEEGVAGQIGLVAPGGGGKTTALRHLAAVFAGSKRLVLRDVGEAPVAPVSRLVVAACVATDPGQLANYHLAPWELDDFLEYLLAKHRDQCASVFERLRSAPDRVFLEGSPALWRIVLDVMAERDQVSDVHAALLCHLNGLPRIAEEEPDLHGWCLDTEIAPLSAQPALRPKSTSAMWRWIIRFRPVRLLLAAERISQDLEAARACQYLGYQLSRSLIHEVAARVAENATARARLTQLVAGEDRSLHPMVASVLHRLPGGWTPAGGIVTLTGAYLDHARWPGLAMEHAELSHTDFTAAILKGANLQGAVALHSRFDSADLRRAYLRALDAQSASFTEADLSNASALEANLRGAQFARANLAGAVLDQAALQGADLRGASLVGASLRKAVLAGALIEDADFSGACLDGAGLTGLTLRLAAFQGVSWAGADLRKCDLEYMELPDAVFAEANLEDALLTGTRMLGANFSDACLRGAGLAEIDWEDACLRGADLRGASFHLGSSRSGLVGSPIASEGSRTGFYTDDFTEQDFKSPEEIRKANLCGADLREAILDGVDFYLVDLRGARFDPQYEAHLRECGAILESRS